MDPKGTPSSEAYEFGAYRLDVEQRLLSRDGQPLPLTPKSFDLLLLLVRSPGRAFSKQEILTALWPDSFVEEANLAFQVSQLRKVLGRDSQEWIQTVQKHGYRFAGPVVVRSASPAPIHAPVDLPAPPRPSRHTRWVWPVVAAVAMLLAGGVASRMFTRQPTGHPLPFEPIARPLTAYPGIEREPSLSPDGSQVAFVWNGPRQDNFDIYVKLVGPGEPLRLTTSPEYDDSPAWSPDGASIAFLRARVGNGLDEKIPGEIFIVPALGGAERRLATVFVPHRRDFGRELSWTPDGKWLVVTGAFAESEPAGLWLIDTTGSRHRRLSAAAPESWAGDVGPRVSFDGRTLAWVEKKHIDALFRLPLSPQLEPQGQPVVIERDRRNNNIDDVAWDPDGRFLIYSQQARLRLRWLAPGGLSPEPAELLPFGEGASTLSLAPSGPLVYSTEVSDTNLWTLDLTRTESAPEPPAISASTHDEYTPAYSFDGTRVAFASTRSGSEELWLSNVDGTGLRQVTFMGGPSCADPQWSPDDRWIVFHSASGGSADVYLLSAGSLEVRRLTTDPSEDVEPKWSRDGRWIYFGSNRTGRFEVWKMRADGGSALQITHGGGLDAQESSDGRFLYYAKPETPTTIWRMPVGGGAPTEVVDRLSYPLNFIVSDEGIYFVGMGSAPSQTSVDFFDFRSNTRTSRAWLGKLWSYGIALSPDRRQLLFPTVDSQSQDLMMVNRAR